MEWTDTNNCVTPCSTVMEVATARFVDVWARSCWMAQWTRCWT